MQHKGDIQIKTLPFRFRAISSNLKKMPFAKTPREKQNYLNAALAELEELEQAVNELTAPFKPNYF